MTLSAQSAISDFEYGFSISFFSSNLSIPISVAPETIEPKLQDVMVKPFSFLYTPFGSFDTKSAINFAALYLFLS